MAQAAKSIPRRLKPELISGTYGTTEEAAEKGWL
jgi:hypothetical protein